MLTINANTRARFLDTLNRATLVLKLKAADKPVAKRLPVLVSLKRKGASLGRPFSVPASTKVTELRAALDAYKASLPVGLRVQGLKRTATA